jgi:hypothetical protein
MYVEKVESILTNSVSTWCSRGGSSTSDQQRHEAVSVESYRTPNENLLNWEVGYHRIGARLSIIALTTNLSVSYAKKGFNTAAVIFSCEL